jgi:hypothetical protein
MGAGKEASGRGWYRGARVKIPTLAAKSAARMGHPHDMSLYDIIKAYYRSTIESAA